MPIRFCKYQALGNDYLVLADPRFIERLTARSVKRICDRHFGVGADGILTPRDAMGSIGVTIWNADGSKAEKSGNGLRIFTRFLWDEQRIDQRPVWVATDAGDVLVQVLDDGTEVQVEMGRLVLVGSAASDSRPAPVLLELPGRTIEAYLANLGNPHCVVFVDASTEELARELGPQLEHHGQFPDRTNVQFVHVRDRDNLELQIWERGSGYTLSSGSSASAAAGVAFRCGMIDAEIHAHMPGGGLAVSLDDELNVTIRGPVQKIAEVALEDCLLEP